MAADIELNGLMGTTLKRISKCDDFKCLYLQNGLIFLVQILHVWSIFHGV